MSFCRDAFQRCHSTSARHAFNMIEQLLGHPLPSEQRIGNHTLNIAGMSVPLNLRESQALPLIIRADQKGTSIPLEKTLEYAHIHRAENIELMSQSGHEFRVIWLGWSDHW